MQKPGFSPARLTPLAQGAATPVIFTREEKLDECRYPRRSRAVITVNANWSVVLSYRFEKVITDSGALRNEANIFKLGLDIHYELRTSGQCRVTANASYASHSKN